MSPAAATPTSIIPPPSFTEASLAIDSIHESATNPRRRFDDVALQELAISIAAKGVLSPLLVRRNGKGYELVAGARRLRASRLAGLETVPCRIADLTDGQARELQIIENLQRQDIHPLDEADGFTALQKADKAYSVEAIAARVGRSVDYVKKRLRLSGLSGDTRKAFEDDRITAAHAAILVKVPAKLQKDALKACFYELFEVDDEEGAMALRPVRQLEGWYRENVVLDLASAETQESFPELAKAVADVKAAGGTLIPISHAYYLDAAERKLKPVPLTSEQWRAIEKKRCDHVQTGVILLGRGRAQTIEICTERKCATHWPELNRPKDESKTAPKRKLEKWEIDQRRRQAADRAAAMAFGKVKVQAVGELLAKGRGEPVTAEQVRWVVEQLAPTALNAPKQLETIFGPPKSWTPARAPELIFACFALRKCYSMANVAAALKKQGIDVVKLASPAKAGATSKGAKGSPAKARTRKAASTAKTAKVSTAKGKKR